MAFVVYLQMQTQRDTEFKQSSNAIALDLINLTQSYQAEEQKWTTKQNDNITMASIIHSYDSRYQSLLERTNALDTPDKYKTVRDMLALSIQTEQQSNDHLRSYLITGNATEYKLSSDYLSKSYAYSGDYNAALTAAG